MSSFQPDRTPLDAETDARIDALLTEFFRAEIPAALPDPTAPPASVRAPGKADFGVKFLWWGTTIAAASLLAAVVWLKRPMGGDGDLAKRDADAPTYFGDSAPFVADVAPAWRPARLDYRSEWHEVDGRRLNATIADGAALLDVRAHRTSQGVYEQRTRLDWTSVRFWEPTTGAWIEATVPEVRVEVTRVDEP